MEKNPGCQDFAIEKDRIVVYLPESEYDFIEKIGLNEFSSKNHSSNLIRMYAIIRLFTMLNPKKQFVPIHSGLFRKGVSSTNYTKYREALVRNNIIQTKKEEKVTFNDERGVNHIVCKSPMSYRIILMSYRYSNGIFAEQSTRTIPVGLSFDTLAHNAVKTKIKRIQNDYNRRFQEDSIYDIMKVSEKEICIMSSIIKLIKDVFYEKVKSISRFDRRVYNIAKMYDCDNQRDTIKHIKYNLSILIYNILLILYKKNKKIKYQHIAGYILSYGIDNQSFNSEKTRHGRKSKFSYYCNLSIDIEALDHCVRMSDLYIIAKINKIPRYHYPDKKLYSSLANIRKVLRKFVRYQNSLLIEVSDIHAAHFTMIPLIFKRSGIIVSDTEIAKFKKTTQNKDFYSDVVRYCKRYTSTKYTREDIKPVLQPFFSIKSEKQFLYNRSESERERRELVCKYFKHKFPGIYQSLIGYHLNHSMTIKSVANKVESEIMNDICDTIRKQGLHPFRIHDAIYLPQNECGLLTFDISQAVFEKINKQC